MTTSRGRCLPALLAVLLAVLALPAAASAGISSDTATLAHQRSGAVTDQRTFRLQRPVTHVALHWRGARSAHVDVAFSRDGRRFGRLRHVHLDEVGRRAKDGETYGEVMVAPGVRAVRVVTDRRLRRLTVLGLTDRGRKPQIATAAGHVTTSPVILRGDWGADESLRFNKRKQEIWPPAFYAVQKLIVHHTAGENDDPDPAATIRSIYHYHAVTQGWGDIGYNFLVDEAGRVYEGRYSGEPGLKDPPPDTTPGEDGSLNGVTAAHAYGYNSGTVGVALLGTLTSDDAAAAARTTLEEFLAWEADRHGLDPKGSGTYTNPVNGTTDHLPNILAHRDVTATACPGDFFYGTLTALRDATALRKTWGSGEQFRLGATPEAIKLVRGKGDGTITVALERLGTFTGTVGLTAEGLRSDAPVSFSDASLASGESASTLTISTSKSTATGKFLLRVQGTGDVGNGITDTRATTVRVEIARR